MGRKLTLYILLKYVLQNEIKNRPDVNSFHTNIDLAKYLDLDLDLASLMKAH